MMIQDYCVDQLHVRAFDTRQEMGDCAGQEAAACLKRLLAEQDEVNVIFAAAPSQNETLAALCRRRHRLVARQRFHMTSISSERHPFGHFSAQGHF